MKSTKKITHEDFGFFQTELLQVDFITSNLTKLSNLQTSQLVTYFQNLAFNYYLKKTEISQAWQKYYNKNHFQNQFELEIILKVAYQKETKFNRVLSCFDLVYECNHKLTDKISIKEFLNFSYVQFQYLYPYKNTASERNRKRPAPKNQESQRTKVLSCLYNG